MILRLTIFTLLNFAALGLGGLFTSGGVSSDWYSSLAKAPWTPPGWVFGAAWTTIMILYSFYMAKLVGKTNSVITALLLFGLQWTLNVSWNPIFFYLHYATFGLVTISILTILIFVFFLKFWKELKLFSLLILPYLIWLMIATSLNGYIVFYN